MEAVQFSYLLDDRNGSHISGFKHLWDAKYMAVRLSLDAPTEVFTITDYLGAVRTYKNGEQIGGPED